jgi:hypothetical protein
MLFLVSISTFLPGRKQNERRKERSEKIVSKQVENV